MPDNNFMQPDNMNLAEPTQRLDEVKPVTDSWVAPKLGTAEEQRAAFNNEESSSIVNDVFDKINSENEQRLSQGIIARADANPARYLHAVKTAEAMGINDYDLVYDNLDEFEKQRKAQEMERRIRLCDNLKDMCTEDPTLIAKLDDVSAGQLKQINDNLVIYGSADEKTGLSGKWARTKYTYNRAEQEFGVNELAFDLIGTRGTERAEKLRLLQEAEKKIEIMPQLDTSGWSIGDLTLNAVEQLPYQVRTTLPMAAGTLGGAAAGSLTANPVGVVAAGVAGNAAGRAVAFYNGYKAESGSIARELLQMRDDDGKPLDDDIVDMASRFYGGISSAIEQIGAEGMLQAMGLKSITKIGLKNAVKEAIKDKTKREIFVGIARDFTKAIGSEATEEAMQSFLQSGVQRAAKDFARLYRGDNYEAEDVIDGLIEDLAAAGEAGLQGAKSSIMMAGVPAGIRTGYHSTRQYRAVNSKVRETKAKADIQILDNAQKQVQAYAESEAFEPKTLGALFQRVRRQSIYRDIFVKVDDAKALMQSEAMLKNKDTLVENGIWADMERQISTGEELGTPVRIGFADFGEKIMPSPELYAAWKDVISTYEDGITLKEIKAKEAARANWIAEGQKRAANRDANFEYAYKRILENEVYAKMPDLQRKQIAELTAGLMCYMAEQSNTNIQEFVNQRLPQYELSLDGNVGSTANVQGIIQAVRDEALTNEAKNLINVSKTIAKKDINAIKRLLLSKIDNPNTADVKKYVQIVNAITDMKLNLAEMSDDDIINHLADYTKSGELKLDIKRNDEDRAKSGLYSASETALKDIQAATGGGDYVLVGGGRIPVDYQIVELDEMVTSHDDTGAANANYPQELQPRDRSRSASDVQITNIVKNFAPERVARAEIATEGAPIVTKEGFVAVGNGRAMAIRQVYNNEETAQVYKNYLINKGYDLSGFNRPVLVRRLAMDMSNEQLRALVDDANTAGTMQYSDSENALRDAAKMTGNLIDLLDIDADIDSAANKRFLNGFFGEVVPTAERNAYLDKDDKITRKGVERVENALVAKLLPDARFLSVLVENPDNNIRKVTKSLAKAAPAIIGFENDIAAGRINADYSIAGDVAGAVDILKRAKDRGVTAGDYIKMTDMFAEPISSSTQTMVQLFENTSGATDFLSKILSYIHNAAEQGDLTQGNMFGIEPMTKLQLLEREAAQQSLFQLPNEAYDKDGKADINTPEFKAWFGDSQVVDEKGLPLVVYHGGKKGIKSFSNKYATDDNMFFFTSNKGLAREYQGYNESNLNNADIYPVYLKIQKPLVLLGRDDLETMARIIHPDNDNLRKEWLTNEIKYVDEYIDKPSDWAWYMGSLALQHRESIKAYADKNGYDGVFDYEPTTRGAFDENYKGFIAFNPNQIKSVYNRGTWSAASDNIYYQRNRDNLTGDLFDVSQNKVNNTKPIPLSVKQDVDDLFSLAEKKQSVKKDLPLFSLNAEAQKIEKIYKPSKQIEDVGDSLLGNLKRDSKQYQWSELENMNDLLRKKYVTKNYIFAKPTIEELRARGFSNRGAAVILSVYNSINAKPAKGFEETKENQQKYFNIIHRTMDNVIAYVREHQQEIDAWNMGMDTNVDMLRAVFPSDETIINRIFRTNKEYNTEALIAGGNKFINSMIISGYDLSKIDEISKIINDTNTKKSETNAKKAVWEKYFQVHRSALDGTYFVADSKTRAVYSRNLSFKTYEEAFDFAEKLYQKILPHLQSGGDVVDFSNMRVGLPRRKNNQNINAQALVDTFGFRGINFGNWTKQQERQEFLNLTYDSLLDMSEILGIPPRAIGLEGKLGLAFGAQGRSGAAGHFIPEYNEINLTRKNGAGSLAHEWWHALDYYFGDQSIGTDFSGKPILSLDKQGNLRAETFTAIRNLYDKIMNADIDAEELEKRRAAREKQIRFNIKYRADEIKRKFSKSKNSTEISDYIDKLVALDKNYNDETYEQKISEFQKFVEERRRTPELYGQIANLLYHLKQLNILDESSASWRKSSEFVVKAQRLNKIAKGNGADYWTRKTELGARAFASYIQDKVTSNNWYNYFLSGHAQQSIFDLDALSYDLNHLADGEKLDINKYNVPIYPAVEVERNDINAAFDNLFKTIRVDESNNYRLYQNENSDALGAYIPLERKIVLFRGHNLSTIIHETGHWWLDTLSQVAQSEKASDKLKNDWQTIKDWLEVGDDNIITTEQHEKFARGVEKYFRTKQAPSSRLAQLFDKLRRWLTDVYKDVKELDVELNDDVVRVFDHMLASDAEIEEYRQAHNLKEMFDRADVFGLSAKDFEKYKELAEDSLTLAKSKHFADKAYLLYKEETDGYKEAQKQIKQSVIDEWCNDKYNRALYAIYRGKVGDTEIGDILLNESELKDLFGDNIDNLPKKSGKEIYAADGMRLDDVADLVGLSVDELKGTLLSARKRTRAYKAMLDKRTHEELGDPVSYDDIQKQVISSISNDKRASLLRFELNAIGKDLGKKSVLEQSYEIYAQDKIAGLQIRELKPQTYAELSQKAGDKALAAMERGNRNEAYRQKEIQIRNFYLFKEAEKQADIINKDVKRLKQIGKKEVNDGVDQVYQDAARAVLGKVDLSRALNSKQRERLGNLALWVMEQEKNGYSIVIPSKFLEEMNRVNYTELSVSDFLALSDGVKSLIHNGRAIKEFELGNQIVDREKLLAKMSETLKKHEPISKTASSRKSTKETIAGFLRGLDSFLTGAGFLFNRLDDGDTNGVFHQTFLRPLSEAQVLENDLQLKYAKKITDLTAALSKETKKQMYEYVADAETRLGGKYTLEDLITIGLNMGNKDNLQRLKDGNGFSDNQLNWVKNYLSQEHWDYIQAVWDVLESMYPMLEEHHKKMSGLDMDKVFPIPVQTNYGTYRGGYFPIVYDRDFSPEMESKAALFDADYNVATTSKGYTKQRRNKVNAPIKLGLMNVAQHMNTVIHDVAYRGTLRKLWNLANNSEFIEMFDKFVGKEYRQGLNDLLKTLGNEPNREIRGLAAWEKILRFFRRRATLIGLGFRMSTALAQPLGFFSSIATMTEHKQKQGGKHGGSYWLAVGHKELIINPKIYEWAMACSGELRNRLGNQDASISKRIKELTKNAGNMSFKEQAETWAYKAIGYMDFYVSTVTWLGAYRQATLDFGMKHEDAIFYADRVMLNSQGTGTTKDTAAVQRSNEGWRALTMFYSFFSALYQQSIQLGRDVKTAKSFGDYANLSARFMAMYVLPSCLDSIMRGETPEDDEDSWLAWLFDNVFGYFIGGVPILRDVYSSMKYHNTGSSNVGRQVNYLGNFSGAIGKAFDGDPNWQKISKNGLNSFAVITGYPTGGQIADTASYFVGVAAGEIEPHGMSDILWGIYKGKERK